MIEVWAKLPDQDGVLRICFRPTRNDVTCICEIDSLGPGIICERNTNLPGKNPTLELEILTRPVKISTLKRDFFDSTAQILDFTVYFVGLAVCFVQVSTGRLAEESTRHLQMSSGLAHTT